MIEKILTIIIIICIGLLINEFAMENKHLEERYNSLADNYNDLIRANYELQWNLSDAEWELYLAEKRIPSFMNYLNNTHKYSSCWLQNGTISGIRKDGCYNCENFTADYISNIKNDHEAYYVVGEKEGHLMGHAFAKVCVYVDPTENQIMSRTEFEKYKIHYEIKE